MPIISDHREFNILTFCYIQNGPRKARFAGLMEVLRGKAVPAGGGGLDSASGRPVAFPSIGKAVLND